MKRHTHKLQRTLLSATLLGLGISNVTAVHAAGFGLQEQNASGLGVAYAGSGAVAENASTIYYNPAGMTNLPGLNISVGGNYIIPSFKFSNDRSSLPAAFGTANARFSGAQLGDEGDNAGGGAFVPNAYVSWQVSDRLFAGLGIGAPFGLATDYGDGFMGRYHSKKFDIETINFNPSLAYKLNNSWSIGAGINIQRIKAEYEKSTVVDMRSQVAGAVTQRYIAAGVPAQQAAAMGKAVGDQYGPILDGEAKVKMKDTALGWNIGVMFHPSEDTRIGLSYRSRIKYKATGDTDVDIHRPSAAMIGAMPAQLQEIYGLVPGSLTTSSSASVTLPDTALFSVYQRISPRWELLGDIQWTGWSSLPKLTIKSDTLPEAGLDLRFKDSWRIAVGAMYQVAPQWKLKAGVAWDQSPVRSAEHRPASLPDNDRYWFSVGAQYKPSENTAIDVGYSYMYLKKSHVDNTNDGNLAQYGRLSGSYKSHGHIFGLQVSHRF